MIWIQVPVVLVKKPYTASATRQAVELSTDQSFDGTGTFTVTTGAGLVRFFDAAKGGAEIQSGHVFAGGDFSPTVTIYAEGVSPSAAEKDITVQLSLTPGSKPVKGPATAQMTSVEVTLDICKSRTKTGSNPDLVNDKINQGRTVHVQTGFHHGRAMLIVRKAKPESFSGKLSLSPMNNKVRVFADPQEVAAGGQSPLANPYEIPNPGIKAPGVKLWAEGADVSSALRDTGFKLGVSNVDPDGDRVVMTVVQFSQLRAEVPSTEANTVRMGNAPVPNHSALQGGHAARDYDESFTTNPPLVLIESSILAAKKIKLSVQIKPRVPVFWDIQRNEAPAPVGDHAGIIRLSPKPKPTLEQIKVDTLGNKLMADAVGSFHIRPFVDCNDSQEFEYNDARGNRIDREPFAIMNLVLVRAQGYKNNGVQQSFNCQTLPAAGMSAATGVGAKTGGWTAATAGVHNAATITLIGGGANGRLGLDKVFVGWVNNIDGSTVLRDYLDNTVAPPVHHLERFIWAQNSPTVPPRVGVFYNAALPAPVGLLSANVAPTVMAAPLLDTTPFGLEGTGGNTCVGTEGAVGPPIPVVKTPLPSGGHALAYGEDWTVEQWDSPGNGAGPNPIMYPGNLVGYQMDYDFRTDLVIWTNITAAPGATADAGCRLYSSVQTNKWTVRFRVNFDPPGSRTAGTAHVTTPLRITMTKDRNPTRLSKAVEGIAFEVRFPISLRQRAWDATS